MPPTPHTYAYRPSEALYIIHMLHIRAKMSFTKTVGKQGFQPMQRTQRIYKFMK